MFKALTDLLLKIQGEHPEPPPAPKREPVDGVIMITEPEQIPETFVDISDKEFGDRYLGLDTGIIYLVAQEWEFDD